MGEKETFEGDAVGSWVAFYTLLVKGVPRWVSVCVKVPLFVVMLGVCGSWLLCKVRDERGKACETEMRLHSNSFCDNDELPSLSFLHLSWYSSWKQLIGHIRSQLHLDLS